MSPKKILIATAVIIILSGLLSGCGKTEESVAEKSAAPAESVTRETVEKAQAVKKDVSLALETAKSDGKVKVTITLKNPEMKPITSVQAWLSFAPAKLKGEDIDTSKTAFSLTAPYDNSFDNESGLLMLGRSNPTPVTYASIHVAEVTFDVMDYDGATVDAYDYREDLSGHTSANALVGGVAYNILVKPESPALMITK